MATIAAFCDADVLVPILCCDFIITAAEAGLVDIVVSDLVLHEVETSLAEQFSSIERLPCGLAAVVRDDTERWLERRQVRDELASLRATPS